ncbi:protein of unknown function [Shewanella benthica]|uniref:Uncharacterized protein n=1 Tax=Shewanella benthica TaxID=43661 RepID=A0A330M756_9GAMM|nr:protein of unknown function [Shewanella benthica]
MRHDFNLRLAYGLLQGMDLTIGIGYANIIKIDESHFTYTTPGQRLSNPSANTTYAYNSNMRLRK